MADDPNADDFSALDAWAPGLGTALNVEEGADNYELSTVSPISTSVASIFPTSVAPKILAIPTWAWFAIFGGLYLLLSSSTEK